jgi:hypothetical protein
MYKLIFIALSLATFLFQGCGSSNIHGESTLPPIPPNTTTDAYVFDKNSTYSNVLLKCINLNKSSCTLNTLPLLTQENKKITKQMIMSRLVVSHSWMAKRFSELLDRYANKDLYSLFGAVTAIVIHKDIIPSFYTEKTGAIYIDPHYLWLTPEEASTITDKNDFRQDFGSTLKFIAGSVYTQDNNVISKNNALDSGKSRTLSDIELPLIALLYHELAHANDFAPRQFRDTLDGNIPIEKALNTLKDDRASVALNNQYPLTSSTLKSIGKVLYHGKKPTEEQKQLSAEEAGNLFNEDRASDIYAYSNIYEDTATLFADSMMKIHYNIDSNVVFLNSDDYKNNKIIIKWGIKNAIAKENVKSRALLIINKLNPIEGGWDDIFNQKIQSVTYLPLSKSYKLHNQKNTIPLRIGDIHIPIHCLRY